MSPRKDAGREAGFADSLVITSVVDKAELPRAVERAELNFWNASGDRMTWFAYSDALRMAALGKMRQWSEPLPWREGFANA